MMTEQEQAARDAERDAEADRAWDHEKAVKKLNRGDEVLIKGFWYRVINYVVTAGVRSEDVVTIAIRHRYVDLDAPVLALFCSEVRYNER